MFVPACLRWGSGGMRRVYTEQLKPVEGVFLFAVWQRSDDRLQPLGLGKLQSLLFSKCKADIILT
jgi:hypothetical protein